MSDQQIRESFYARREAQERAVADRSEGAVRRVHLVMAERYAALIRGKSPAA